jgi:hypothetical protein
VPLVVDWLQRALRGRVPRLDDELKAQFKLVGARTSVYCVWDKQWITGRVVAYDVAQGRHVIECDDETRRELPLFAIACWVGTSAIRTTTSALRVVNVACSSS